MKSVMICRYFFLLFAFCPAFSPAQSPAPAEDQPMKARLNQSSRHLEAKEYAQAKAAGRALLLLAQRQGADSLAGAACHLIGQAYYYEGEYQQALKCFQEGIRYCPYQISPALWAQLSYRAGVCHIYLGELQVAIDSTFLPVIYQKEGLLPDGHKELYNIYVGIGAAYRRLGLLDSCENAYQEALQLLYRFNIESASIFYNLRQLYEDMGKYDKALKYALLTLQADEATQDSANLAQDHSMLAKLYSLAGELENARKHADISVQLTERLLFPVNPASIYANMARVQKLEGDFQGAAATLEKALKMNALPMETSNIQISLGECYLHLGDPASAERFLLLGNTYQKKTKQFIQYAESSRVLAVLYMEQGKWEQAEYFLKETARYIESSKNIEEKADFYAVYSDFLTRRGRHREALGAYKLYTRLQDSIFSLESMARFQELSAAFKAEELKNDLLKKENEVLKEQQRRRRLLITASFLLITTLLLWARQIYRNIQARRQVNAFLRKIHDQMEQAESFFQAMEASLSVDIRATENPAGNAAPAVSAAAFLQGRPELADEFNAINQDIIRLRGNFQRFQKQLAYFEQASLEEKKKLADTIEKLQAIQYSMAHDLKGPLFRLKIILNNLFAYSGEGLAKGWKAEALQILVDMESLINSLVLIMNIEQAGLRFSRFSLGALIESILREQAEVVEKTGAVALYDGLPEICSDRHLMKIVWGNLISNALKFSSHGQEPHIVIKAAAQDDKWLLSIKDNGIGWEKGRENKLFQPFSQLSDIGALRQGSGVGLFITRKILKILGGDIIAERGARGATFTVMIPEKKKYQRGE
ncbi:MAG: tetratricopeptide repeat protein [Lewinellaceae bacterium]|nr:tetratricopeptide repeat protein [Lewinellaceae bacterium]